MNHNFLKLPGSYLFSEINCRVASFLDKQPETELIRLGIGDVTRPIPLAAREAMHHAVDELGSSETFRGYGPEQGYDFLRESIVRHDYAPLGVQLDMDEVFISDGAKSDCGNIGDLFSVDNIVAVCDPVYPVYVDSSVMAGRAGEYDRKTCMWSRLHYMPCLEENGFLPEIPREKVDMIWLCFPNNPTGAAATAGHLKRWVDYANKNDAVILFDGAYEAFITQPDIPHSIYEIRGAKACAIEFRSFSKTAGFTGVRCGYTVVPKELKRKGACINWLWNRRQCTKFNGVSYIVQRGAQALYTPEGRKEIEENLLYYQKNARVIREGLKKAGLTAFGGENSPYVWCRTPDGQSSWEFFELLLHRANVVTTPGIGFGPSGEKYIRMTAFGSAEDTEKAVSKIQTVL